MMSKRRTNPVGPHPLGYPERDRLENTRGLEDVMLLTDENDNWEKVCQRLVSDLDGRVFEKARTMLQEVKEERFRFFSPGDEPVDLRKDEPASGSDNP